MGAQQLPWWLGDVSRQGRANPPGGQQWWRPDGGPQPPAHSNHTRDVEQQAHLGFPLLLPKSQLIAGARDSCRELHLEGAGSPSQLGRVLPASLAKDHTMGLQLGLSPRLLVHPHSCLTSLSARGPQARSLSAPELL